MVDIDINALITGGVGIASIFKSVASGIAEILATKDKKRQQEIATRLHSEIITLQNALIAAQEMQLAAHDLITHINQRNEEKTHYQMQVLAPGTPVYTIKPEYQGDKAPHHICANCYSDSKKSFLQVTKKSIAQTHYICSRCKNTFFQNNLQ